MMPIPKKAETIGTSTIVAEWSQPVRFLNCFDRQLSSAGSLPHRLLLHPHRPGIGVEGGAGADGEDELLLDVAEGEAGDGGDG